MHKHKRNRPKKRKLVEITIDILGSWAALFIMAALSVAWAVYTIFNHRDAASLDITISIWTMLLDVIVIISANYTRRRDRKLLKEISRELDELEDIHEELRDIEEILRENAE